MLSRQAHIIRRQSLELDIAPGEDAHRLQEEIKRVFADKVVPVMDGVMSERVTEYELLRIDRLELDLGVMDLDRIDDQFVERVRDRLDHVLAGEINRSTAPNAWDMTAAADEQVGLPQLVKLEDSELQLLIHYLRTGMLPWWSREDMSFELETSLDRQLEQQPEHLLQAMSSLSPRRTAARLSKQLSQPLLERMIQALAAQYGESLARQLEQIAAVLNHQEVRVLGQASAVVYEPLLRQLLQAKPVTEAGVRQLFASLVQRLVSELYVDAAPLYERLALHTVRNLTVEPQLLHWLKEWLQESGVAIPQTHHASTSGTGPHSIGESPGASGLGQSPTGQQASSVEENKVSAQAPGAAESSTRPSAEASEHDRRAPEPQAADVDGGSDIEAVDTSESPDDFVELEQGAYLGNAGLVLLWPYLPRFFQTIGFADAKDFLGDMERERAVLMLQYLVSGETTFQEYELLLNKLLCGWPLLDSVACELDIQDRERQEADELLDAVVQNWQTLKNTSRDGMREAFLRREGRLNKDDLGWQLKVNRTSIDVLLESLPWGIGLIRLPWMDDALRVEW